MDDTALTAFSFNALLYLFIFLSFFTGLLHAQSGGGAARLKLNRNVTASSNPPSNIQQTFTWPNKSKCLVVLYLISSYFLEPVCSVPRRHGPGFECRRRQQVFFSPKRTEPFWKPPTPYSTCLEVIFRGVLRTAREADHSPHIVSMLRMNGTMPLLPLYVFRAWIQKVLPLQRILQEKNKLSWSQIHRQVEKQVLVQQ
jgi:hypothetical protein